MSIPLDRRKNICLIGTKCKTRNRFSWGILKVHRFWPKSKKNIGIENQYAKHTQNTISNLRSIAPLKLWCSLLKRNHINPSRTWLWNILEIFILIGGLVGKEDLVPGWIHFIFNQIWFSIHFISLFANRFALIWFSLIENQIKENQNHKVKLIEHQTNKLCILSVFCILREFYILWKILWKVSHGMKGFLWIESNNNIRKKSRIDLSRWLRIVLRVVEVTFARNPTIELMFSTRFDLIFNQRKSNCKSLPRRGSEPHSPNPIHFIKHVKLCFLIENQSDSFCEPHYPNPFRFFCNLHSYLQFAFVFTICIRIYNLHSCFLKQSKGIFRIQYFISIIL